MGEFGFTDSSSSHRLPGQGWEAGNMFTGTNFMPNCNMENAAFNDTVWGYGPDGKLELQREHPVLTDIFYSNAMRRLQAVEQLTLSPEYSTIPNTGAFSRFEHMWGSVLFVGKIARREGIDPRTTTVYQLRTLLSDMAHTTGSHLGDWMFQGVGEQENQHDIDLQTYLEATGIIDILKHHGFDPAEVIFPDVEDWIEAPSPGLCVDRVDYGLREMNRWNQVINIHRFSTEDFELTPENQLAMVDQRRARMFAEGFLLLSQEHWSEPTHRFMLDMLMLRTKLLYAEGGFPNKMWVFNEPGHDEALMDLPSMHPRDLMYVTDPVQLDSMSRPNLASTTLDGIMRTVAQYHRQYVWPGRQDRINGYMQQFADPESYQRICETGQYLSLEDDQLGTFRGEYPPYLPTGFAILDQAQAEASATERDIDFAQPPFKVRQIDPLVKTGNEFVRLSQLDDSYAERLAEHKAQLAQAKVARLSVPDDKTRQLLRAIIDNVELHWEERLATSRRMTAQELGRLVDTSAMHIHGRYPFLNFLDY